MNRTIPETDDLGCESAWPQFDFPPGTGLPKLQTPYPGPERRDQINHPAHYTAHPSGVECITVTEHMGFNLGNAVKYIWRADAKGNALEDLKKAEWYIKREIARRGK